MEDLNLDPAVRAWVFLPLTFCIICMKLLQQYAHMVRYHQGNNLDNLHGRLHPDHPLSLSLSLSSQLMNPTTPPPSKKSLDEIKEQQLVARSQRMRMLGRFIPETGFRMRKEYFIGKDTGVFHQKSKGKSMQEQMATNPDMLTDMVKKGLSGMVPQLAMGFFVNFFFSGFVMGKIPFPLSPRFKPMLQRGIDLVGLDVSYFTSLSYYILLLFGLQASCTRADSTIPSAIQPHNPSAPQPPPLSLTPPSLPSSRFTLVRREPSLSSSGSRRWTMRR